jgi:hypothetical protein
MKYGSMTGKTHDGGRDECTLAVVSASQVVLSGLERVLADAPGGDRQVLG